MWLYIPSTSSPSVLGSEVSTSASTQLSNEQASLLARSVTSRGKLMQPRYWSSVWKKRGWIRHLSGVTSPPSMLDLGLASWTASLVASHARAGVTQESNASSRTSGTSTLMSRASSRLSDLDSSSSRTSPAILLAEHLTSPETCNAWATELRRHCSERRRLAPLIAESGSSSSAPADQWPTTTTTQDAHNTAGASQFDRHVLPLNVVASMWPTVVVGDSRSAARHTTKTDVMHPGTMLLDAVRAFDFPTPSATEYGSSQNGINGKGGAFERPSAGTPSLSTAARQGALPGGAKGVLNPVFVEALMGWPLGWTEPLETAQDTAPFPPPPRDTEGWAAYLRRYPSVIPAVGKDAVRHRVDRLRACGNGVVPQQAAAAFWELFSALEVNHVPDRDSNRDDTQGPSGPMEREAAEAQALVRTRAAEVRGPDHPQHGLDLEALRGAMTKSLETVNQWQQDRVDAYADVPTATMRVRARVRSVDRATAYEGMAFDPVPVPVPVSRGWRNRWRRDTW